MKLVVAKFSRLVRLGRQVDKSQLTAACLKVAVDGIETKIGLTALIPVCKRWVVVRKNPLGGFKPIDKMGLLRPEGLALSK
jgi:hypothetical protein